MEEVGGRRLRWIRHIGKASSSAARRPDKGSLLTFAVVPTTAVDREVWVAPLLSGTLLVVGTTLPGFLLGALAPLIDRDLTFGPAQLGLAVAVFNGASALTATKAGRLVDRIGSPRALPLGVGVTAAATLAIAALVDTTAALLALIAIIGVSRTTSSPIAGALVSTHVPPRRRGITVGAQQAGAPLASVAAGVAVPLVADPLGWRWTYVAAVLVMLVGWITVRRTLSRTVDAAATRAPTGPDRDDAVATNMRPVVAAAVANAFGNAAAFGLTSFLVVFATDRGVTPGAAGLLLAAVSLLGGLSRIALGHRVDRRGGDRMAGVAPMLTMAAGGYVAMATGQPVLVVAGAAAAGVGAWGSAGLVLLAVIERHRRAPGHAIGVTMTGIFVGACVGPLVAGVLIAHISYAAAWLACAGMASVAAAIYASVRRQFAAEARPLLASTDSYNRL